MFESMNPILRAYFFCSSPGTHAKLKCLLMNNGELKATNLCLRLPVHLLSMVSMTGIEVTYVLAMAK